MNMRNKVPLLQSRLSHAAKQSLNRKFGALYDKIYRSDVLWTAWKQVRSNRGAPGIDDVSIDYVEEVVGEVEFLKEIQSELHARTYRPQPVKRCWIDKPGKPDKRPLGIPVLKDRVVQMATKLVIEPIFEANFLPCSYGFRPGRSAHDAIDEIRRKITFEKRCIVIDADIKGYFQNIDHTLLLNLVGRRINDPRVLALIKGWLKSGVMDRGSFESSEGTGTPQGGVISPLLANIYLHSFDKMFLLSGIRGTLVRYADDLVILLKEGGARVLEKVRVMLGRLGLELHTDKTRIADARRGFDFLGVHFRLCPVSRRGSRLKESCRLWPSDTSFSRIKAKICERIGRRYSLSLEEMIVELNPVIRGWNNYHTRIPSSGRKRLRKLNGFVRERLRIFLKRKHSISTRGSRRLHNNILVKLGLYQFG
jgi:group II intron reverse transcriptase/maturase